MPQGCLCSQKEMEWGLQDASWSSYRRGQGSAQCLKGKSHMHTQSFSCPPLPQWCFHGQWGSEKVSSSFLMRCHQPCHFASGKPNTSICCCQYRNTSLLLWLGVNFCDRKDHLSGLKAGLWTPASARNLFYFLASTQTWRLGKVRSFLFPEVIAVHSFSNVKVYGPHFSIWVMQAMVWETQSIAGSHFSSLDYWKKERRTETKPWVLPL